MLCEDLLKVDIGWVVVLVVCLVNIKGGFYGMRRDVVFVGGVIILFRNFKIIGIIICFLIFFSSNLSLKIFLGW